ncbi:MAG: alpha/beta hydrolase [Deltaproteobacteria bacterium]|nr:alpha/beta hydrolase [Deltaproteobacteria bacterium]
MRSFALLALLLWTTLAILVRRLFRGPLHPGWSLRYELVVGVVRASVRQGAALTPAEIRRGTPRARIHPKVKRAVSHQRTEYAGMRAELFTPAGGSGPGSTLLYLHGGGYIMCSPATHRDLISRIAEAASARTIAVDYRKAPEHPFPLPIDDAERAYRALLAEGVDPSRLFVGGDSAGGGLTLALLQRLRDDGLPLPRAAVLLSPWVDLTCSGDSIRENAHLDYLPADRLAWGASQYLGDGDPAHPHASAVNADLRGLPPLLVLTGGAELFLSENRAFVARAEAQGVAVTHEIEPGMVHVYPAFASFLPACAPAIDRIGAFMRMQLPAA